MAKFKIEITRIDEYEVDIDENVWTPDEIKDWSKTFYPASDSEDIAKYLAYAVMRSGSASGFMEGFGNVKTYSQNGRFREQFGDGFKKLTNDDYSKGLSVKIISEDEDYDHEISKIN